MATNPYAQYRQQGVLTASPTELVVMLYEGCIKQLKLAKIHLGEKNYEGANNAFQRAQDIITELVMGLDFNYDIARELLNLYEFVQRAIIDMNISKDMNQVDPIVEILDDLRTAWVEVVKQTRAANFGYSDE